MSRRTKERVTGGEWTAWAYVEGRHAGAKPVIPRSALTTVLAALTEPSAAGSCH